jgi:hypothetical protein
VLPLLGTRGEKTGEKGQGKRKIVPCPDWLSTDSRPLGLLLELLWRVTADPHRGGSIALKPTRYGIIARFSSCGARHKGSDAGDQARGQEAFTHDWTLLAKGQWWRT